MLQHLNLHPDKRYRSLAIFFFIVWICCRGPLRWVLGAKTGTLELLLGMLPNFFAGITLLFWQVYMTRISAWYGFVLVTLLLAMAEVVQLFMRAYRFDWMDVAASAVGAGLAALYYARKSVGS